MDEKKNAWERDFAFVGDFISRAADLAYVEGAQGTSRLLVCLCGFLRYLRQDSAWVPLADELKAVEDYMTLCRMWDSGCNLSLPEPGSQFVPHRLLVDAVMRACAADFQANQPGTDLSVRIELLNPGKGKARLTLTVDKSLPSGAEHLKRQWEL